MVGEHSVYNKLQYLNQPMHLSYTCFIFDFSLKMSETYCKFTHLISTYCQKSSKIILSTCKRLSCSSAYKASTSKLNSFLRYCKDTAYFRYLSALDMADRIHQKWQYQVIENCDTPLHKKSTSPQTASLKYRKDFATSYFWVIQVGLAMISKTDTTSFQETLMFIFMQKIIFIPRHVLEMLERYLENYLEDFGHTQSCPSKTISLTSRRH